MTVKDILIRTRFPVATRNRRRHRDELTDLGALDELVGFFRDLTSEERFVIFDGVRFDTYYHGAQSAAGLALLGLWYGLFEKLFNVAPPGIYARIWLPRPVRADLRMVSRGSRKYLAESLDTAFRISVANREYFDEYLGADLREALLRLSGSFSIRMDDECVRIGPLAGSPHSSAEAVHDLIAALPPATEEVPSAPDFFAVAEADEEVVCVARPANTLEADLVQSALRSGGIPCSVLGYEQSRVWGNTFGFDIKVVVPKSFEERAMEFLEDGEVSDDEE